MSKTIVALDFSSKEEVVQFLSQFNEPIYVKIGMELTYACGLEMVKTVTFRNPLGSLHGNFNNFDTNGVMPAGKFEKFLLSLTISLHILPAVPFLFWVLKQVQ